MDKVTRAFLVKVAQRPIDIDVRAFNSPEEGRQFGTDVSEWATRLDTPEGQVWQRTKSPQYVQNVRNAGTWMSEQAQNPQFAGHLFSMTPEQRQNFSVNSLGQFAPQVNVVGQDQYRQNRQNYHYRNVMDQAAQGWSEGSWWNPFDKARRALTQGTTAVISALRERSMTPEQHKAQFNQAFSQGINPQGASFRQLKPQLATSYASKRIADWTSGLGMGGVGKGLNSVLQFILGLASRTPGYNTAVNWLTDRFGNLKQSSHILPPPYSHYRQVARLSDGSEVLSPWNRS